MILNAIDNTLSYLPVNKLDAGALLNKAKGGQKAKKGCLLLLF